MSCGRWQQRPPLLLVVLSLLLGLLVQESSCARPSGLYIDNGYDQTIVHRMVTEREKREVEHEILNLLGLPDRPPKGHRTHAGPQVKRSASKFLLDIYKNALDEENRKHNSEFEWSNKDLRAIDQSDVIMTFTTHQHHVPGVRHERGKRLWFDVSEVPPNEIMLGAELRLYRDLSAIKAEKNKAAFTLTVYRVINLENGERELQYVDAVNASANHEGWLTLNVSVAMQYWVQNPTRNRGVYLSVHPANRHVHEMKPEDIGIIIYKGVAEHLPFMVGFFKSTGARQHRQLPATSLVRTLRTKREAKKDKKKNGSSLPRPSPYSEAQLPSHMGIAANNNTRTCKIQTLYVSFRDLQWQDWIIAPDGYDAYYCSGECNFPLNAHMNATNHAIVQTLVHLVNPGKVPKPCCAPTKLSPISVLFFSDDSNVILKKYKNMVVKSCGCH